MNFLTGVQGYNPNQGIGGGSLANMCQCCGMSSLNRLDPTGGLQGIPGAPGMDPTSQLLAQQQQGMQQVLTAMLGLLLQLMQGAAKGTTDGSTAGGTGALGDASGGGGGGTNAASDTSGANTSGGSSSAPAGDKAANAKIVAEVARQKGVDPVTAVACMLVESGGSNAATGDNGTSFGLFQLHRGGELGNMSEAEARDPRRNAETALSVFAANKGKYSDPGQLAAASQRPADREGYARKVDAMLPEARRLLGM